MRPDPKLKHFSESVNEYQNNWLLLTANILKHYHHPEVDLKEITDSIQKKRYISYELIIQNLNLAPHKLQSVDGYKNIWGPVYWEFLHLTSIICTTTYQKSLFSANMLNFNLAMICGECSNNFKAKDPFTLTMIMTLTQDIITPIFDLHNKVNSALNKPIHKFEEFKERYNINSRHVKIITVKTVS